MDRYRGRLSLRQLYIAELEYQRNQTYPCLEYLYYLRRLIVRYS